MQLGLVPRLERASVANRPAGGEAVLMESLKHSLTGEKSVPSTPAHGPKRYHPLLYVRSRPAVTSRVNL